MTHQLFPENNNNQQLTILDYTTTYLLMSFHHYSNMHWDASQPVFMTSLFIILSRCGPITGASSAKVGSPNWSAFFHSASPLLVSVEDMFAATHLMGDHGNRYKLNQWSICWVNHKTKYDAENLTTCVLCFPVLKWSDIRSQSLGWSLVIKHHYKYCRVILEDEHLQTCRDNLYLCDDYRRKVNIHQAYHQLPTFSS